jgi:hypothetical protein
VGIGTTDPQAALGINAINTNGDENELNFINAVVGVRDEAAAHTIARQKSELTRQNAEIVQLTGDMNTLAAELADLRSELRAAVTLIRFRRRRSGWVAVRSFTVAARRRSRLGEGAVATL